ncbi:unnamed protein product [Gongylonema pulchrum]|uniref:Uncharacterized protein n=1 Tax=Gongylonema pulchrum TaxID=637853 RepID=A0A3P7LLL4_9BILA|nr:unnamed protein product [Gongylonema pulchrum]
MVISPILVFLWNYCFYSTLISIADKVEAVGRVHLLRTFVLYYFRSATVRTKSSPEDETIHSALCRYVTTYMTNIESDTEALSMAFRQFWFLFVIAAKSMALRLLDVGLYKVPRGNRFSPELLFRIGSMIDKVVSLIIAKHRDLPQECRHANSALAYFLRYCLSFMNRGSVFSWIHCAVEKMDESDSRTIRFHKLEFLQIIFGHEHLVPLCLPVMCDASGNIFRKYGSFSSDGIGKLFSTHVYFSLKIFFLFYGLIRNC